MTPHEDTTSTLVIDERIRDDGGFVRTRLEAAGDRIRVTEDDGPGAQLTADVVITVMRRYGRPLADDVAPTGPRLPLGGGVTLCQLRHHAPVDTEARDYTVLCADGEPPLAALSTTIAAALRFLVTPGRA